MIQRNGLANGRQNSENHPSWTEKKGKKLLNEDSLRDLWDSIKHTNIHIIGVPEREGKWAEKLVEEVMAENFPYMGKRHPEPGKTECQTIWTQRSPRHIIIKIEKIKHKRSFKSSKRNATSYVQGHSHKTLSWLFSRKFAGQKGVAQYIQSEEMKNPKTKNTLPSKVIIQIWRKESFTDNQKLKEFSTTKPALKEILKGLL